MSVHWKNKKGIKLVPAPATPEITARMVAEGAGVVHDLFVEWAKLNGKPTSKAQAAKFLQTHPALRNPAVVKRYAEPQAA